ncbi:MAG: hypothetical protein MI673_01475, partial [Thiotrichales bacterium]|nr:hypothetical protein [Thiotrichales bacterium]
EGRRDDRILLTSITNPGLLKPWLALLEKYQVPLAAVSSVAIFTQELLEILPDPSDNMLVVTLQSISGLRQSFFANGELKISRSIKMPRFGTTSYTPFINQEIEKIRRYLSSLRFISGDEPLDVYFLSQGQMLNELRNELKDTDEHRYHLLDLQDLALRSGANLEITTPFSDQLLAFHALRKKPDNHYARERDVRYFTMRKLRYAMYAASAVIMLSGFIYSGINLLRSIDYKQQSIAASKKTDFYNERYRIAREGLPETPVEPRDLQVLAKIADDLKKYKTTPMPILQVISAGLDEYPTIILDGLQWAQSSDPDTRLGDVRNNGAFAPNQPPQAVPGPGVTAAESMLYYQIANMDARISNFNGNYRQAIATINSFAEMLRQQEGVTDVTVISLPLNISSDSSLQGTTGVDEKEALFTMKIALGVKEDESG